MQVDKELVLVRQTLCSKGLSHTGQSVFVSISGPPPAPLTSFGLFSQSGIAPVPSGRIAQLMGSGVVFFLPPEKIPFHGVQRRLSLSWVFSTALKVALF